MEPVKELVKKTMPSLSSERLDALLARLEELGVTCVDDLIEVQAQDLERTLPIIQCRRLVRAFQAGKFLSCTALTHSKSNHHIIYLKCRGVCVRNSGDVGKLCKTLIKHNVIICKAYLTYILLNTLQRHLVKVLTLTRCLCSVFSVPL